MLLTKLVRLLLAGIFALLFSFAATPMVPTTGKKDKKKNNSSSANYAFETHPKMNAVSARFITQYLNSNFETLQMVKAKSSSTFKMMDKVFTKYNLPLELKYLAVVESELKPTAVSKVGAVGTWQLMPETAKILGLKITRTEDERKSTHKSTRAAALYLRDLYTEFNDWLIVLAAYNCGPGPVYKAMKKSGSKNFWVLQKFLPAESREHVHKFIATHQYFEGEPVSPYANEWNYLAAR